MRMLSRIRDFLLSIKFGVALMLALMLVMMFATQFEASTSTRAMKRLIYGSAWFDAGVFLFVVNLVVNTIRRRPYGFRHAGFLTVHAGVITIVAGGLLTRYQGIDGTMPIPEGETASAIMLPENDVVVEMGGVTHRFTTHYDIEPWKSERDDVFEIPGTKYALRIDRYYPAAAVTDTLIEGESGQGPILQVALGTGEAEPISGWLVARDPQQRHANVGPATIHFVETADLGALEAEWTKRTAQEDPDAARAAAQSQSAGAGSLQLMWADGGTETIRVPRAGDDPLPTSRAGVDVHVDQVFRAFVLTDSGFAEGEGAAPNPAVKFHLVGPGGPIEEHFSFTQFPEFRMSPIEGKEFLLSHASWVPAPGAASAGAASGAPREIAIEWKGEGRLALHTSWQDPLDGTPIGVGETRPFDDSRLLLRVVQAASDGRVARTVSKTSDEVENPVLHVRLEEDASGRLQHAGLFEGFRGAKFTPSPIDPNRAWVFYGTQHEFAVPEGPIKVRYESRTIPLDFGIHLRDFQERRYPGVALAASYESHVDVLPPGADAFQEKIYMNHPLKYAGYVFYQASFQRTPDGEITVLSVARDPGMTLSFVGYVILVAGLLVIFFVKPVLRRLDDRLARARAAGGNA